MISAQIIDAVIGSLADVFKDFTVSFWGVALFTGISIVYGIGQYLILGMVKSKNREEIRRAHFNILERIVSIVQYVLTAVLILVVLQIILNSGYSTVMLRVAVMISYGFTIYTMSALSYSLFSWFRVNKILVVLLYGSGVAVIIVYVITVALIFDIALQEKPALITPQSEIIFTSPTTIESSLNTLQTLCSIAYFLLIWGGNILLLHQNVHRIGKVKFWVLISRGAYWIRSYNEHSGSCITAHVF